MKHIGTYVFYIWEQIVNINTHKQVCLKQSAIVSVSEIGIDIGHSSDERACPHSKKLWRNKMK